jgi:hypothetical protein
MKALLLTFNLLCGADSATTHTLLATHRGHEAGWAGRVTQNPYALDAMNAGQCVAVSMAGSTLPRKVGVPLLLISIAARGYAVQHNARLFVSR